MSVLEAAVLGLIQGLTEFLPVSSSGHLVIGQALLGVESTGVIFEVVVHLATLCAIVWVYRKRIIELMAGVVKGDRAALTYVGLILVASIPAGVVGVMGRSWFESRFDDAALAAWMLMITGAIIWTIRFSAPRATRERPDAPRSFLIGCAQAVAILPGISRSGATVALGAWLGVEVVRLAEFSFLMSVPAILGAGLLQLGDVGAGQSIDMGVMSVGFLVAAVSGVAAIHLFVKMLKNATFHRFAYYCWFVGGAYLVGSMAMAGG
jgi:undecaprenyl-diphosphatase